MGFVVVVVVVVVVCCELLQVMVYSPSFFKYVYDTWLEGHGRYPSTGFLALMFAIHVCDEVSTLVFLLFLL